MAKAQKWVILAAFGAMAGVAYAQSSLGAGPAELPPASFRGAEYVDSRGCAFIRTGAGGVDQWVPRVSRARTPLCGLTPSLPRGAVAASAPSAPAGGGLPDTGSVFRSIDLGQGQARPAAAPARVAAPAQPPVIQPRAQALRVPAPVVAPVVAPPVIVPAPARQAAGSGFQRCEVQLVGGGRVVFSSAQPLRCGPQAQHPSDGRAIIGGAAATPALGAVQPSIAPQAVQVANGGAIVPQGYRAVWTDGRLNPARGPRTALGDAQMAQVWTNTTPMRAVEDTQGRFTLSGLFGRIFGGLRPVRTIDAPRYVMVQSPNAFAPTQGSGVGFGPIGGGAAVAGVVQAASPADFVVPSARNAPATAMLPAAATTTNARPALERAAPAPIAAPASGRLIRVADFASRGQAEATARQLAELGMTARLGQIGSGGFALLVGPYASEPATTRTVEALHLIGFHNARIQ